MSGTVKKWDDAKGYGFIEVAGMKKDIFVHHTGIVSDGRHQKRKQLFAGDPVEFDTVPGDKGPKAVNVRVV